MNNFFKKIKKESKKVAEKVVDTSKVVQKETKKVAEKVVDTSKIIGKETVKIAENTGNIVQKETEKVVDKVVDTSKNIGKETVKIAENTGNIVQKETEKVVDKVIDTSKVIGKETVKIAEKVVDTSKNIGKETEKIAEKVVDTSKNIGKETIKIAEKVVDKVGDISKEVIERVQTFELSSQIPEEWLNSKVTDLVFFSSHNSYLDGLQILSFSSLKSIENILKNGVRCIELDVFTHSITQQPYIAHGAKNGGMKDQDLIVTTPISFEDTIITIAQNAFTKTNLPLFICIENNTDGSEEANNQMESIFKKYLGNRLIYNRNIPETPLQDLLGKVILLSDNGSIANMRNLINVFWWEKGIHNISSNGDVPKDRRLCRVYPAGDVKGVLSLNFDGVKFVDQKANLISLNIQGMDGEVYQLAKRLNNYPIFKL